MRFLVADPQCIASIRFSINAARENVRTTRHCLPEPFWELVNELHNSAVARRGRFDFLDTVTAKMQQLSGVIYSSMTRDHAFRFMRMGGLIECADMTSRVVDVATTTTLKHGDDAAPEVTWLWANLLRSLSAVSACRREAGLRPGSRHEAFSLHIYDALETAAAYGVIDEDPATQDTGRRVDEWRTLSVVLNELNRSSGLGDPYPFVVNEVVADKLGFVDEVIRTLRERNRAQAGR